MEGILADIKEQYTNISISHLNQCPCHLQNVAVLELVCCKPGQEPSDQEQHCKSSGMDMVGRRELHLTYSDLFMKQREPKRPKMGKNIVLIKGEAGIGKTILCSSIVDDWASGRRFKEFFIVLLLPLCQRNIASVHSLFELVGELYKFNEEMCSAVVNVLTTSTSNILIIADGWDQLSEPEKCDKSFLHQLLFGSLFPYSSVMVIITSRPSIGSTSLSTLTSIDQVVTIKGFSKATIQSCIESELSSDPRKIKFLTEQLENNPLVKELCSVPLNLAIICSLCQTYSEPLPCNMSELYTKLVWNLAQVSMKNNNVCMAIKSHHDLSEELQRSWWFLCELAFTNVEKVEAARYLSAKISHFGLLKSVSERQDEVLFCFRHPTIQDYLAAQHLAQQPLTTQLLEQCAKMGPNFWRFFLCAYVGSASYVETDIIIHAIHLLSKLSHCSNNDLCHCSFEAKNEIIDHEVVKALSTMDDSGSVLLQFGPSKNAHDCMAIIHVIENIQQQCIVEINLHNCNLTAEQTCKLGRILGSKSDCIQVKGLDLSHNGLSDSNIVDFFHEAIATLLSVEKLLLNNCGIRTKGVSAMIATLTNSVMQLDLSLNPLSMSCLQCLQCHIETGILVKLEIFLLKGSLPNDICMSYVVSFTESLASKCPCLRLLDLSDNNLGEPGNPELSKVISRLTHLRRDFYLHLNDEYTSEVNEHFVSAMQDSIMKRGTIDHTIAHGIIVGPGRSGKNTLMRRLLGEKVDSISSSTGVLESVVKVEVQKMCTVAAAVNKLKWRRLEYDEEALELMMTTAKYPSVSSTIPKPICIKHVVQRSSDITTTSSSPILSGSDSNLSVADQAKAEYVSKKSKSANDDNDETIIQNTNVAVYSSDVAPVDILKRALKLRDMDALREHLESSWSLYLTNTGGQTEFQELLPILVCGPSVFFVTFPLHFDLEKPYKVKYEHPDGKIESYQSSTTLIEELLQTLATISALDYTCSQCESDKVPKVFFIGTHKDQLLPEITAKETIKSIDEQLQKHIKRTVLFKKDFIQFNKKLNRMIFVVNNLSTDDDDFQMIRSAVQNTVESKKHSKQFKVTCPSSWLIFSLILREQYKSQDRFLSFEKCFDIAQECGISNRGELTQALSFIHSRLGLVRYFNVEDLDGFVIVDPQILFDNITHLIVKTFTSDCAEESEIEDFQRGIIPVAVVERINSKFNFGMRLPFTWLTKLLNYLRIAALFTDRDGLKKYFFPSAICHAPESKTNQLQAPPSKSLRVPSLLVGFKSGFCPRGIPGALVKYLMTNEMKSLRSWELHPDKIFRNQVSFGIKAYGSITLRMSPTHLEIYLNSEEDLTDSESRVTCEEAYTQIKNGMRAITSQYIKCEYFFGFYCTLKHKCKVHPHPAKIDWQKENPSRSTLKCTVEHLQSRGLPMGYDIWNIKKKRQVATILDEEIDSGSDGVPNHLGQIADSMAEWEGKIADTLKLKMSDVAAIKYQWPTNLKMQSREALKLWKQQLGSDATYNKLIRVFERAGYKEYADYVRKVFRHRDHSDSDTDDSSSSEDSYPLPQPQTYPNLKPPSPSEFPSSKPLPHEFYSFILSENLPEGCVLCHEELESCNITFLPELSLSNIDVKEQSRSTSPAEHLEPPPAKKLLLEEDYVQEDVITEGVQTVSGAPGKPQATEVTSTHIKLSWTKPDFNGEDVIMYAVYFRSATDPTTLWERMQTNSPEETITITDLIKGESPFIFKVCSINNSGEGAESEESDEIMLTKVGVKDTLREETIDEDDKNQEQCALHHQEAMEVDKFHHCTPEEALSVLIDNNLSCNLRVLGSQLGLKTSDLDISLPLDQSYSYQQQLLRILSKYNERELLSWTKIVSILRKPALNQYKVANRICNVYKIRTESLESGSIFPPRLGSLETLPTVVYSPSVESEPEISEMVNEIANVRDWEQLALSLGLSSNDIDMIKQYDHQEHRQRMVEMWYDRDQDYSWTKLQRELNKLSPQTGINESGTGSPPEADILITADVESQIQKFERRFQNLSIETRKEFEAKHSVEILTDELFSLPSAIAREHYKFVTRIIKRKHRLTNLRLFFLHLDIYCWNFLEYQVLESLIKSKCSEALKEKMSKYAKDIEGFKRQTTITDFIKCGRHLMMKRTVSPHFQKSVLEHVIDPDVYTLADLHAFRRDTLMGHRLKLSEFAFQVYSIKHS